MNKFEEKIKQSKEVIEKSTRFNYQEIYEKSKLKKGSTRKTKPLIILLSSLFIFSILITIAFINLPRKSIKEGPYDNKNDNIAPSEEPKTGDIGDEDLKIENDGEKIPHINYEIELNNNEIYVVLKKSSKRTYSPSDFDEEMVDYIIEIEKDDNSDTKELILVVKPEYQKNLQDIYESLSERSDIYYLQKGDVPLYLHKDYENENNLINYISFKLIEISEKKEDGFIIKCSLIESYNDLFNLDTANTMLLKEHKEEFYLLVPLNIEKYLIIEKKYLYQIKELVNEDGFMYFSAINNIETLMPLMLNDLSFNETENEWLASVFNHYFIDLTGEYCQKDEKNKALLKIGDNLDYFKKLLILLKKCQDEHQMINSAYIDVIRMELKNND